MYNVQPGILAAMPRLARYLTFSLKSGGQPDVSLCALGNSVNVENAVVGLGLPLFEALGKSVRGLKSFPTYTCYGFAVPSTPSALWIWLRGDDRGELLHETRHIEQTLADAFKLEQVIDAFQYRDSRDLTGYEGGTGNPQGDDAVNASIVQGQGDGLDGSSFVAVQQWLHDLDHFQAGSQQQQDNTIGRRMSTNEEISDAPESAHIKRAAQQDSEPKTFVLRRSMPWADSRQHGLLFAAFGCSVDAFETLLRRMVGEDDGIVDALFGFTRPISGSYFWCPPVEKGRLDLRALDFV